MLIRASCYVDGDVPPLPSRLSLSTHESKLNLWRGRECNCDPSNGPPASPRERLALLILTERLFTIRTISRSQSNERRNPTYHSYPDANQGTRAHTRSSRPDDLRLAPDGRVHHA